MKVIEHIWLFLSWYVFIYPLALSILWMILGAYFWWRRERKDAGTENWPQTWPPVTILVPCHNEAKSIAETCISLELLNYPNYEVIFIDDCSTDNTVEILEKFIAPNPKFHLLRLASNCGKAQALNYALKYVETSISIVIDADTILTPLSVNYLVVPFCSQPRLGAVTGNPLVLNRSNILQKLQAAEFASIIGLIKRAQRVMSRVLTVSGCLAAYRTELLKEVGGFSTRTATEDIDITWQIQRHFNEVWYMPQATAYIQCPATLRDYWKQRKRWALGGWHLLRTHKDVFKSLRFRYLYPTYIEFVLSFLWSFIFVFGTLSWILTFFFISPPVGFSPIPAWYGAIIAITCVTQIAVSLLINRRYDKNLHHVFFWVPWYPIFLFAFGALTIVWTAPKGLFGTLEQAGKWKSPKRVSTLS